ncbi:FtsX-like permease family protein [Natronomonas sp. EA1]|uniref:FtsX-like permease family protein n=1 Tax=Natronomonas sp. EA1 TaxID=3421655 RepID=UPI003EBF5E6E
MSYRRALCTRFSRRDKLAVLTVGLAVAFLTGTTLVVFAVGGQTASIAAELDSVGAADGYDSVAAAEAAATPDDLVLPYAERPEAGASPLAVAVPTNATVAGQAVEPLFPDAWAVVPPGSLDAPDGALVLGPGETVPDEGVPLRGALAFFLAGTGDLLAVLGVVAVLAALLVGVVVFSVTRTTVRARTTAIRVIRSTGATPGQVRRLFLARTGLVVGFAVLLGYGLGVVLTNTVVTVAVMAGLPTSLATRVTGEVARVLVVLYGGLVGVSLLAAFVAVWPASRRAPARLSGEASAGSSNGSARSWLTPSLLDSRTVVPTAATLTAFIAFVFLLAGVASVAAPVASTDTATVTEPGATHPIASQVPADYAAVLESRGVDASAEILLFAVRDGQAFPARGANFSAFAELSDATLTAGRPPTAPDEAVIGAGLADTLGVETGETVLLGGSTHAGVTRVTVVGTFTAAGSTDDQLVVPLATARHLHQMRADRVQFIRAARLPEVSGTSGDVTVANLDAPDTVAVGTEFRARVTLRNEGLSRVEHTVEVRFGDTVESVTATVPAGGTRTATVRFTPEETGETTLSAGEETRPVSVLDRDAIRLVEVPREIPTNGDPLLRVVDAGGTPVAGVQVHARNRTAVTNANGYARLQFSEPGSVTVTATRGNRTTSVETTVAPGASRDLDATVSVSPSRPSLVTRPTLSLRVRNPWNETVTRTLTVETPSAAFERRVTLTAGNRTIIEHTLARQSPGRYDITVSSDGEAVAATTYTVTGDERLVAALAVGGRSGTTGIGQAVAVAFGNLELAVAALLLLGGLMAVGGTASTFSGAIQGRRRTIGVHRAVGAGPLAVARLVLADALRIGLAASLLAVVGGTLALLAFDALGLLTVYGVQIQPYPSPPLILATVAGALAVTLAGAGVALARLLRAPPAALLGGASDA